MWLFHVSGVFQYRIKAEYYYIYYMVLTTIFGLHLCILPGTPAWKCYLCWNIWKSFVFQQAFSPWLWRLSSMFTQFHYWEACTVLSPVHHVNHAKSRIQQWKARLASSQLFVSVSTCQINLLFSETLSAALCWDLLSRILIVQNTFNTALNLFWLICCAVCVIL